MERLPVHTTPDGLEGEALEVFTEIQQSRGMVVGALAALLNSPPLARLVSDMGAYMRFHSVLEPEVRELTILAALRETDCEFEWSFHEKYALEAGVSQDTVDVVKYGRDLQDVPAPHAEVIQVVRELLRRRRVSPATRRALLDRYDDQTVTEIVGLTGYYALVSQVLNFWELPGPDGAPSLPRRPVSG
jgi:4-carboxymuconolactone decarboxylase